MNESEMISTDDLSPMMKQYMTIKNQNKDSILFFRLGDFYEMFFEDAKLVSEELGLTLTGRDCGREERAPMCGIPYHSCESYIARLIAKGYKIAMCDQTENPSQSKGLVKREVVRVITPGTVVESSMLDESKNNYICSVYCSGDLPIAGITFCDVSTGELKVTEILGNDSELASQIKIEIGKFSPREVLCIVKDEVYKIIYPFLKEKLVCNIEILKDDLKNEKAEEILTVNFNSYDLKSLNLENKICSIKSIAYLFKYLKSTQKANISHISFPVFYDKSQYMGLDLNTIRNLELVETLRTKSKKGSLLWIMDRTKTPMGKRLLRNWIERPLLDTNKILLRQGAVEIFFERVILREKIKKSLSQVHDMQRLMTRISYASANAKDLRDLAAAVSKLPEIKSLIENLDSKMLKKMYLKFDTLNDIYDLIEKSIKEKPALTIKEGQIIKEGYSPEVDRLRNDLESGATVIAEIQERERKRTGIPKLKVAYNKIYGYYIEITNLYKDKVPSDYIRRRTLNGAERYVTDELKELEARILNAKEIINETEYKIFESIRNKVAENFSRIIAASNIVAALDVIVSLAEVASHNNYVKPEINNLDTISIKQGRHPVVESIIREVSFVPNDVILDNSDNLVSIITGPNMAGKSTYMRQTALIVLMAQIGGFVPALSASIGIVDNIFTRIGASDDLAAGQSTFMVEMTEVADIIKNSTSKSLLILDEIGRGTSTFDGMSIARAVLEYVSDKTKLGAKTLFATHYHELTEITKEFQSIKNYSIAVERKGEEITFLHTIVPGISDDSYGIEVARLAGLPQSVILRAKEILNVIKLDKKPALKDKNENVTSVPLNRDLNKNTEKIISKLNDINLSTLNPIESINILYSLINLAKSSTN